MISLADIERRHAEIRAKEAERIRWGIVRQSRDVIKAAEPRENHLLYLNPPERTCRVLETFYRRVGIRMYE